MNVGHFGRQVFQQGGVEGVVGPFGQEHLGLFGQRKVLPSKRRLDILFVQRQNFVVRNDPRVGQIDRAGFALNGQAHHNGHHVFQHGHAVGDATNFFIIYNFGNEIARVVVADNGHADAQV